APGLSVPSAGLPNIQPPTTLRARTSRICHLVRAIGPFRSQASPLSSKLAATPRRNGFVLLQAIRSLPAAPHPVSERRNTPPLGDAVAFSYMRGDSHGPD